MYNIYTDPSIHPCIARPNGVNLSYPSMCQTKFGPYKSSYKTNIVFG